MRNKYFGIKITAVGFAVALLGYLIAFLFLPLVGKILVGLGVTVGLFGLIVHTFIALDLFSKGDANNKSGQPWE